MGLQVYWDTAEQALVRLDVEAPWNWAEYDRAIAEAKRLIASVEHTVDVISNRLHSPSLPLTDFYPHLRYKVDDVPRNLGLIVVVGAERQGVVGRPVDARVDEDIAVTAQLRIVVGRDDNVLVGKLVLDDGCGRLIGLALAVARLADEEVLGIEQ